MYVLHYVDCICPQWIQPGGHPVGRREGLSLRQGHGGQTRGYSKCGGGRGNDKACWVTEVLLYLCLPGRTRLHPEEDGRRAGQVMSVSDGLRLRGRQWLELQWWCFCMCGGARLTLRDIPLQENGGERLRSLKVRSDSFSQPKAPRNKPQSQNRCINTLAT